MYTQDTLPDIFIEIAKKINGDVGKIFYDSSKRMQIEFAGEAWEKCIESSDLMLTHEDKEALKSLGKMLGTTDLEGQVNQLNLVNIFLDEQIKEAIELRNKNETMYKKLGIIIGLAVVIILA